MPEYPVSVSFDLVFIPFDGIVRALKNSIVVAYNRVWVVVLLRLSCTLLRKPPLEYVFGWLLRFFCLSWRLVLVHTPEPIITLAVLVLGSLRFMPGALLFTFLSVGLFLGATPFLAGWSEFFIEQIPVKPIASIHQQKNTQSYTLHGICLWIKDYFQ